MECSEVQKRLSAYLEKVVSSRQKALIDGHLKKCKKCRQSLADLKKAVEYVQKLEEVEPPAWLAQKVMAQVRAEAEAKRVIWQRLFRPFHIKLPLEAIALIFVAVGAFYIFKAVQPAMRLAKIPTEQREMAPAPVTKPKKEAPAALSKERPAPTVTRDQLMYEKRLETQQQRSVGKAEAPEREEATPAVPEVPDAGTTYRDEFGRTGALAPHSVGPKTRAAGKARQIHFVVDVKDLDTASRDIEGIVQQLGGRAIKNAPIDDKAVIEVEIDAKKVQELTDQLHLIGEVQEKGLAMEQREGDVEIRVEVERISPNP
jgi:hypothetical protein